MTCIPNNSEKYISFTIGDITFKDTFAFMPSGLADLVKNLQPEQLVNTRRHFELEALAEDVDACSSLASDDEMDDAESNDEQFIDDDPVLLDDPENMVSFLFKRAYAFATRLLNLTGSMFKSLD